MNRKVNSSILAGALLGAAIVNADILVDNFLNVQGQNQITGNWLADADSWVAIGGSSKVTPVADTANLVQGEGCGSGCYAGHNIFKAYQEDAGTGETMLSSDITVSASVPSKTWAYAGWVMNFVAERGKDGKQSWELLPHEKGNIVDISACSHLELQLQFDLDKQLWISLYSPITEKDKPASPQYGWRYKGTGAMEIKKLSLAAGGLSGIGPKWNDPAATAPLDLKTITRLQIFYEGQEKLEVKEPAPYDAAPHRLTIKKVQLNGAACKVVGTDSLGNVKEFGTVGIRNLAASKLKSALELNVAAGRIQFAQAAEMALKVTVLDMAGQVVASGDVNAARTSMDVSGLRNGVYHVRAAAGAKTFANTITLLK